jgi:hypothetical protein
MCIEMAEKVHQLCNGAGPAGLVARSQARAFIPVGSTRRTGRDPSQLGSLWNVSVPPYTGCRLDLSRKKIRSRRNEISLATALSLRQNDGRSFGFIEMPLRSRLARLFTIMWHRRDRYKTVRQGLLVLPELGGPSCGP